MSICAIDTNIVRFISKFISKLIVSETSFFSNYVSPEAIRFAQNEQQRMEKADMTGDSGYIPSKGLTDAFRKSILESRHLEQRGVMRSNCIDCLDRTNVAQVGK